MHADLRDRLRARALLRMHGGPLTAFQLLQPELRYVFTDTAFVAYVDTGGAWVAGGGPGGDPAAAAAATSAFVEAATRAGRRACFFAADEPIAALPGMRGLLVGEQPVWDARAWPETLRRHRSLREQLRRARAKGLRVRQVTADEMADPDAPTRRAVERLIHAWLDGRAMEPMRFLVDVRPFDFPEDRLYLVAEHEGGVAGFLAAVPAPQGDGWFFEDLLRSPRAPNGTTESLVDAGMRAAVDRPRVTLGLSPLAGPVRRRLRFARAASRPLYDFRGLHAFKRKLRPDIWEPLYLVVPRGHSVWLALGDSLVAFAGGHLVRFGARTFLRGPPGLLRLLALGLALWTPTLALLAPRHFPSGLVHGAWVVFDLGLLGLLLSLLRAWRRPAAWTLAGMLAADVVLTTAQAVFWNIPRVASVSDAVLVVVGVTGPVLGATAVWGRVLRDRRRRRG